MRLSLVARITLFIVLILIAGLGVSTIWTIQRESAVLVDQSKLWVKRLTASVIASIESAMLQERPDVTRTMIGELARTSSVQMLTVYRRNGVEAFTDLATLEEVERSGALAPDVAARIQKMRRAPGSVMSGPLFTQALQTRQIQESIEVRDGVPLYVLHEPLLNRQKCQGCHGGDHEVRAVVRVAVSMESVFAAVRQQRNRQIAIGLVTIAAAAAALVLMLRQVVIAPLRILAALARRIGAGDFSARAPVRARDEIGALGAALNDMTSQLATAQADLAARNTELMATLDHLRASRRRVELLEQLQGELSKFVPEAVKQLLEHDPSATELEKRMEDVSVLFLDIAGYTRLAAELPVDQLNAVVQRYFSSFLALIQEHHGDVNETAGDGLMIIFQAARRGGAGTPGHAVNATRAALAVVEQTATLNEAAPGARRIELHLGINTGQALVGATKLSGAGGSQRWTFTATGPTTNLAARLAAAAEPGDIVVGPDTAERIRRFFVLRSLGEQRFKNISTPVAVYRVVPPGVYETLS